MSKQHFVIVCIINDGFADEAMDAARAVGARGGTVLSARGTANIEAEKAFHIQIQPEKEMIMILVDDHQRRRVARIVQKRRHAHSRARNCVFNARRRRCWHRLERSRRRMRLFIGNRT